MLQTVGKKAPQTLRRIVKSSAQESQRSIIQQLASEYYIDAYEVRKALRISGPSGGGGGYTARVQSRGARRELIHFRIKPERPQHTNRPQPIQVGVKKAGGLKMFPGAFVQDGKADGRPHVLRRVDKPRYPAHIRYGPAIPGMMSQQLEEDGPNGILMNNIRDGYEKAIEKEISKLLGGK